VRNEVFFRCPRPLGFLPRGLRPQLRGIGNQDVRWFDRWAFRSGHLRGVASALRMARKIGRTGWRRATPAVRTDAKWGKTGFTGWGGFTGFGFLPRAGHCEFPSRRKRGTPNRKGAALRRSSGGGLGSDRDLFPNHAGLGGGRSRGMTDGGCFRGGSGGRHRMDLLGFATGQTDHR
jgi:hypothetical protein